MPKNPRLVLRFGDLQSSPSNWTRVVFSDPIVNDYKAKVTPGATDTATGL